MKNFALIILMSALLTSCFQPSDVKHGPEICGGTKMYTFKMTYFNGDCDTINFNGTGDNRFRLRDGDLLLVLGSGNIRTLYSGVREYEVLSIWYTNDKGIISKSKRLP